MTTCSSGCCSAPPGYPVQMGPTRGQMLGAALLVLTLLALVVILVGAAIPPGGPPTLK